MFTVSILFDGKNYVVSINGTLSGKRWVQLSILQIVSSVFWKQANVMKLGTNSTKTYCKPNPTSWSPLLVRTLSRPIPWALLQQSEHLGARFERMCLNPLRTNHFCWLPWCCYACLLVTWIPETFDFEKNVITACTVDEALLTVSCSPPFDAAAITFGGFDWLVANSLRTNRRFFGYHKRWHWQRMIAATHHHHWCVALDMSIPFRHWQCCYLAKRCAWCGTLGEASRFFSASTTRKGTKICPCPQRRTSEMFLLKKIVSQLKFTKTCLNFTGKLQ